MDERIFLVVGDDFTPMVRTPYEVEDLLQRALEQFPDVIAGVSTDGEPNRLLLVKREAPIPLAGAGGTLALDHLFVDADGTPVLVEVKRASNTEVRRLVVAQMLDYAANIAKHWAPGEARRVFEQESQVRDPAEVVTEFAGRPATDFWRDVQDNLEAGRLRLVFVADELPESLVRLIEFLNEQMTRCEVLGVEVPQYLSDGHQVLVPRVIGRTSKAVQAKGQGSKWTRETMLDTSAAAHGNRYQSRMTMLLDHAEAKGRFSWGSGASPGVSGWYVIDGQDCPVWHLQANTIGVAGRPYLQLWLPQLITKVSAERLDLFQDRVAVIPPLRDAIVQGRASPEARGMPSISLDEVDQTQVAELLTAVDGLLTPAP